MARNGNTERFRGRYRISSTRLPDHDYGDPGWYFVTICTQDRRCHFGDVVDGHVQRSPIGQRAHENWKAIPTYFDHARLDAFVVMPNHIHGLIGLASRPDRDANANDNNDVETRQWHVSTDNTNTAANDENDGRSQKNQFMSAITPDAGSLPVIINQYKGAVTRWARTNRDPGFAWQARYYDRVVRNRHEHHRIRQYIEANPAQWHRDRNHPDFA